MLLSREWAILYQKDGFYLFDRHARRQRDPERALQLFDVDHEVLENSYRDASLHQWPWAPYLTGKFTWDQLMEAWKGSGLGLKV
jgi:hypothetical protein